jgi:Protein of unknown function (DUF3489)
MSKALKTTERGRRPHSKSVGRKKAARDPQKKLGTVPQQRETGRRTKVHQILDLLKQSQGATLKAIMAATGWQSHSIRGFVSGYVVKKMGLRLKSSREKGERVYKIQDPRATMGRSRKEA